MNRLMCVPCVASCLGFIVMASFFSTEKGGTAVVNRISPANAENDVDRLMSAEAVEKELISRWNRLNLDKNRFSRVYRPGRYQTPGILANDSLPSPEGSFVGVITLQEQKLGMLQASRDDQKANPIELPKLEYPFIVDRRTGDAMVFAAGQWSEFDQWAASVN